jgi:hypothetical protein
MVGNPLGTADRDGISETVGSCETLGRGDGFAEGEAEGRPDGATEGTKDGLTDTEG